MAVEIKYDNKAADYGSEVIHNVQTVAKWSGAALLLGLGFAFFMAGSWPGVGIVATAAMACYAIGSAFGFLFSIPRSAQGSESQVVVPKDDKVKEALRPRDNTNLEQISDWLVKILVGAGLVNLGKLVLLLQASAGKLGHCLQLARTQGGSVLTNSAAVAQTANAPTNASPGTNSALSSLGLGTGAIGNVPFGFDYGTEFCLFLILYFLALGFLTGYLVTKLWLPYVMLRSSLAMVYLQLEADEGQARKEGARGALREFGLTSADNPPLASGRPPDLSDDPNKGKFGGKPEANGLKLTADVTKMEDIDEDYFRVDLKVITDGKRQLTRPVTFHLHPTFTPQQVSVPPANNVAELPRAAWGAFTVGATVDGEPTTLELDLAELPNAPELFKSR